MEILRKKADHELAKLLKEKREALRKFRFGIAGTRTRNVKEGKLLRREIARIITVLRERLHADVK